MVQKMKAVIMTEPGGLEVLTYTEVDMPRIEHPTDVLVKIKAAGVNPGDCQNRKFGFPSYAVGSGKQGFSILGMDGVGIVEAVGTGITHIELGDEVWYYDGGYADKHGSYAQYKVVNGHYLSPKPKSLDYITAAALPVVALTAWEAVIDRANVQLGDFVLVHGGAGGIGHISIQLVLNRGGRVATTVSGTAKEKLVRTLGAEVLIDYKKVDVKQALIYWTGKDGADVVLDYIGRENFANSIDLVAPYGTLVNTVVSNWPNGNNLVAEYKNLSMKFVNIGLPQVTGNHEFRVRQTQILKEISRLVDAGQLQVHLDQVFPLQQVAEAQRSLEAGEIIGRVVIEM
ncbi:zinc-binding dehydrogenase [Anabaena sp. PCC 7108]|uniref:zinc-binding dehydrogenase n=1 Tax=Anabaena sp. PCC 7108 TaxID=163908 RepID=UPI000346FCE5|nr:zinc-binding dehydrogenase [Anabaena sp. PCC 7108]